MVIGPIAVHGERELDFGVGVHTDGIGVISFRGSASMEKRPVGEGAERPFPCRSHFPLNGIYRSPPPPGASSASSRPLERGRAVRGE